MHEEHKSAVMRWGVLCSCLLPSVHIPDRFPVLHLLQRAPLHLPYKLCFLFHSFHAIHLHSTTLDGIITAIHTQTASSPFRWDTMNAIASPCFELFTCTGQRLGFCSNGVSIARHDTAFLGHRTSLGRGFRLTVTFQNKHVRPISAAQVS